MLSRQEKRLVFLLPSFLPSFLPSSLPPSLPLSLFLSFPSFLPFFLCFFLSFSFFIFLSSFFLTFLLPFFLSFSLVGGMIIRIATSVFICDFPLHYPWFLCTNVIISGLGEEHGVSGMVDHREPKRKTKVRLESSPNSAGSLIPSSSIS